MADEPEDSGTRTGRRSAIRKLGVGAAVAWTAPMIVSAPALAASSKPGCVCGTNVVVNGDAETGALLPWTSYLNTPIGVESWSTLQAAGVEPPTGGGTFAFAIVQDDVGDGDFDGGIREQIDLGTGCGEVYHASAFVSLASNLQAVGVPFLQRARVLVELEIASDPYPARSTTWETYLTPDPTSSNRTLNVTGFVFPDVSSLELRLGAFYSPVVGDRLVPPRHSEKCRRSVEGHGWGSRGAGGQARRVHPLAHSATGCSRRGLPAALLTVAGLVSATSSGVSRRRCVRGR